MESIPGLKRLDQVYTDEEACPPEWAELMLRIDETTQNLREAISQATRRFVHEPDVRIALQNRERADKELRARGEAVNHAVARLNLISPLPRFQRNCLDIDELLKPLYRTRRQITAGGTFPRLRANVGPAPRKTGRVRAFVPAGLPRPARCRQRPKHA